MDVGSKLKPAKAIDSDNVVVAANNVVDCVATDDVDRRIVPDVIIGDGYPNVSYYLLM
jgi:hypothetical protein